MFEVHHHVEEDLQQDRRENRNRERVDDDRLDVLDVQITRDAGEAERGFAYESAADAGSALVVFPELTPA